MLEVDRQVAAQHKLSLRTVETSMDELRPFRAEEFDLVIHPVSTCYLPSLSRLFPEIARVTRPGGLYISQHKTPTSLQAGVAPSARGYELLEPYYRQGPLPPVVGSRHREEGTLEYLHRWEELIGGMCLVGFAIEGLVEPLHAQEGAAAGSFPHRSCYVAPYVRIKARRNVGVESAPRVSSLWMT